MCALLEEAMGFYCDYFEKKYGVTQQINPMWNNYELKYKTTKTTKLCSLISAGKLGKKHTLIFRTQLSVALQPT